METSVKKRNSSIDLLRMIACALVITVHASSFIILISVYERNWIFGHMYNTLGHAGNVLFLMISGSLLLSEDYRFDAKIFYTHNFIRLLAAYVLWLALYGAVEAFLKQTGGFWSSIADIPAAVSNNLLKGSGWYHFWFLPMLMGLYLFLPMLRAVCHTKGLTAYFVALFLIAAVISPTILYFDFPYKEIYEAFLTRIPLALVNHYAGYFVLGYWLAVFIKEKKCRAEKVCLLGGAFIIAGVLGSLLGDRILARQQRTYNSHSMNELFSIGPCIVAVGLFLLVNNIKLPESREFSAVLKNIAGLTFGVYMLHPLFLNFFRMRIQSLGLSAFFEVPLIVLALLFTCMAVTYALSLIPFLRKWLLFMGDKK